MACIKTPAFNVTLGTTEFKDDKKKFVTSIEVDQVSDGASSFKVVLDDDNEEFSSAKTEVKEGMSCVIELGQSESLKKVIEGIITGVSVRRSEEGRLSFVVTGYDGLQALTRGRKRRSWEDIKDSDLASTIADECGLEADVEDSGIVHPYVAQNNQTDLAFLFERAKRIGFEVKVEEKRLVFKKPDFSSDSVATLYWDKSNLDENDAKGHLLQRCNFGSSTRNVVKKVVVRSYDPASAKEIIGSAETIDGDTMGGAENAADRAASNNPDTTIQISNVPVASQEEAERLAASILNQRANNFMTGTGRCDGSADICCGKKVTIKGVGTGLDGDYYVTAAKHVYRVSANAKSVSGYWTDFTVCRSGR